MIAKAKAISHGINAIRYITSESLNKKRGCVKIPPFFFLCWPTCKVKSKKIVLYKIKLFLCKVTRFKRYYK